MILCDKCHTPINPNHGMMSDSSGAYHLDCGLMSDLEFILADCPTWKGRQVITAMLKAQKGEL